MCSSWCRLQGRKFGLKSGVPIPKENEAPSPSDSGVWKPQRSPGPKTVFIAI